MKSDEIIKLLLPVKSIFHLQLQEILQPIITNDYSVFNNKILHGRINNTLIYIEMQAENGFEKRFIHINASCPTMATRIN